MNLTVVIMDEVSVPVAVPPLESRHPQYSEHGSMDDELITRAAHIHTLYRDNGA